MRKILLALLLLAGLAGPRPAAAQAPPLTVFAAASLADGMRALAPLWAAAGHAPLRVSLAASSTLARQIEQGAPADVFASADEAWMDWAAARDLIDPATRRTALGNSLVLVAPAGGTRQVTLAEGLDWAALLGPRGRLAVGDPAHVPAGRYAQQALTALGAWPVVEPRLARAENVRAALLLVERGETPFGVVYATDAYATDAGAGVRVVGTFPASSHTPITYPFAVTRRAAGNPEALALAAFLTGEQAAPVWRRLGFTLAQE
ncbi:molybdate transport system substrate-binding protein [Humitalea rosea]|uniref:Molybdate transport system substrate-binding protein n=1 Tax=Humitalea rosea TaxID=990373 RepID=A0A2W7INL7_9PROT|nr:molybdate ABC transporter substrate-binding protein [Humitalea rosea]PZW49084.1 molybdate transport system substrate-binding protein [Humitalea rosea]